MIGSASRKKCCEARGLQHRKKAARKMEVIFFSMQGAISPPKRD